MRPIALGVLLFLLGCAITGIPSHAQAVPVITRPTLGAATTGTGQAINVTGYTNLTFYIIGSGTVSGGTLLIEEAYYDDSQTGSEYTGTWSQVKSLAAGSDFGTNAQTGYHPALGSFSHVRGRISSNITGGGSITVWVVAVQ